MPRAHGRSQTETNMSTLHHAPIRTRIKICGLTQAADVDAAVQAGADAVGFNRYAPSARYVSLPTMRSLASLLPPFVTPVLLFVNPTVEEVQECLDAVPHALLQFHGDETPDFCDSWHRPYLRAVAVEPGVDLIDWQHRFKHCNALLLDAPVDGYGGGGKVFDWSLANIDGYARAARGAPQVGAGARLPIVLSGGLNVANVIDGMLALRPLAVDVSSGVERAKGVKDAALIRQFCDAVRRADARLQGLAD